MQLPRFDLRSAPLPVRLLATWFLVAMGVGFAAAQVNLRWQHGGLDGEDGLSYDDVVFAFHGNPDSTVLTSKIGPGGSMRRYIPLPADQATLETWVAAGAEETAFDAPKQVLDRLCVRCHNPGGVESSASFGPSRSDGATYSDMQRYTVPDRGISDLALARSTHAHLFGMSVLYALAGLAFLGTRVGSRWKAIGVSLPFVAMFLDIGCWWLTKSDPAFAGGVIAGGALLGVSYAILILRPLWDLWGPGPRELPAVGD